MDSSAEFGLDMLKQLKSRGATVQMQDDVANFVGGYDSSLFMPTVDFILTLQNAARSMEVEQAAGLDLEAFGIPEVYDPNFFEKVSIRASRDAVQNSAADKGAKSAALDYLDNMEIQRADLLGVLGLEPDVVDSEVIYNPRGLKPARKPRSSSSMMKSLFHGLVDKMRKLNLRVIANKDIQTRQIAQKQNIMLRIKALVAKASFRKARRLMTQEEFIDDMQAASGAKNVKKNATGGSADDYEHDKREDKAQETKMDGKAIEDVAGKYEQSMEKFSGEVAAAALQASEKKEKEEKEVGISKEINQTKEVDKASKKQAASPDEDKVKERQKLTQRENMRRNLRLRVQQNVNQMRQKASQRNQSKENVENMSGKEAIKKLKDSGLSISDTVSPTKVTNKDIEAQQKQTELSK